MSISSYRGGMVNGDSYHVELNARRAEDRLGVITQGYGRAYRPTVASDCETDDSGDGEEDTETEEADVRCSTLLLRVSVLADPFLLYYPDLVVLYFRSSLSSRQQFDMHDGGTVISVDWFGAGCTSGEERWDLDLL